MENYLDKPKISLSYLGPAFKGKIGSGYDMFCKICGQVLIKDAYPRQILGLIIVCPGCRSLNYTDERGAGEPISSRAVVIKEGTYNFSNPVDGVEKPELLVSERSLIDYQKEVGTGWVSGRISKFFSTEYFEDQVIKAIALIGRENYEKHLQSYERSRNSKTPSSDNHRIVEVVEYARGVAQRMDMAGDKDPVNIDGDIIAELVMMNSLFERWQNHPAILEMKQALVNPGNFLHTIMQIAIASYLADQGNGVSLSIKEVVGKRMPDILVRPTLLENLNVEVKTPKRLRNSLIGLNISEAEKIIERYVDEAASTKNGQLDPDHSGILAICGSHLTGEVMNALKVGSEHILIRQSHRKPHLAAITIGNLTYVHNKVVNPQGVITSQSFAPAMKTEIIKHPGYKGSLTLNTDN